MPNPGHGLRHLRWLWSHSSILTILLVISVGLNALLANKIMGLSDVNRLLRLKLNSPNLVEGSTAPRLLAKDLMGNPVEINYQDSEKPTVLYVFTPDCHWCARNLSNIKFVATKAGDRYRFLGLSLGTNNLQPYLAESKLPFEVYQTPPDEVAIAYGLNSTPSTIIVSSQGTILHYWRGAYDEDLHGEVEDVFQLKLPGLIPEASSNR